MRTSLRAWRLLVAAEDLPSFQALFTDDFAAPDEFALTFLTNDGALGKVTVAAAEQLAAVVTSTVFPTLSACRAWRAYREVSLAVVRRFLQEDEIGVDDWGGCVDHGHLSCRRCVFANDCDWLRWGKTNQANVKRNIVYCNFKGEKFSVNTSKRCSQVQAFFLQCDVFVCIYLSQCCFINHREPRLSYNLWECPISMAYNFNHTSTTNMNIHKCHILPKSVPKWHTLWSNWNKSAVGGSSCSSTLVQQIISFCKRDGVWNTGRKSRDGKKCFHQNPIITRRTKWKLKDIEGLTLAKTAFLYFRFRTRPTACTLGNAFQHDLTAQDPVSPWHLHGRVILCLNGL